MRCNDMEPQKYFDSCWFLLDSDKSLQSFERTARVGLLHCRCLPNRQECWSLFVAGSPISSFAWWPCMSGNSKWSVSTVAQWCWKPMSYCWHKAIWRKKLLYLLPRNLSTQKWYWASPCDKAGQNDQYFLTGMKNHPVFKKN